MDNILPPHESNGNRDRDEKIVRYKQLNKIAKKNQIVFAGSSLAELFPVNEMLLNSDIKSPIYNRGICGDTTNDLLLNMDTCILDLTPSKLFINIGSNDISLETYNEDELIINYKRILGIVQTKLPETRIYLMSYYPVNPLKESHIDKESRVGMFAYRNNNAISSANKRLESVAKELGLTYIDVYTPLLDDNGNLQESFTIEGIHMWPEGYVKVLEILKPYF